MPALDVFAYGADGHEERRIASAAEARALLDRFPVLWLNVDSVTDPAVVADVGREFGLHPLALEDVARTHQRSKVEPYHDHLYVVLRMVYMETPPDDPEGAPDVHSEQLSLFIGRGWIVTFQESPGDVFDPVRERIRSSESNVRRRGADYLAYRLVDAIVDSIFPVLRHLGDRLESIEEEIEARPSHAARVALQDAKRDLVSFRRVLWPQRDALAAIERLPSPLLTDETRTFLRDPLDHALRAVDVLESYREIAADLRDLYLAQINTRSSEVMRVLTIVATIFIPLTFLAGIWGMNFERMPELAHPLGYPAALALMVLVGGGMALGFRRKGWM